MNGAPRAIWRREAALIAAAHLLAVLWVFEGPLFSGRVPFFRDIPVYYYPNYVFVSRALAQGVWPLWNPTSDAGAPFLLAEPLELALVKIFGPLGALRVSPPLHLFLAMAGASALARTLGRGSLGALACGTVYGLSGLVLSAANLLEHFHGMCWAPAVLAATVALVRGPTPRRTVLVAVLLALQVATLSGESVLQTALVAAFLARGPSAGRAARALLLAACLAALLCAPVLVGAWAMLAGTARARGYPLEVALSWSAPPVVLAESLVPRLFGDVHTFTDRGYWGQPFFPDRYPYFLSLYLGPAAALLAARSRSGRLWALAALGVALSLGVYGPLHLLPALPGVRLRFRNPVKCFFLTTVSVALMAGEGIEASTAVTRRRVAGMLAPGVALLLWAAVEHRWPNAAAAVLGGWVPELWEPRAIEVAHTMWPAAFLVSGVLALGCGLALIAGRRWLPLAVACVGLDLAATNGDINLSTDPSFYVLREPTARLVRSALDLDPARLGRWFSYGMSGSPALTWIPALAARNADVWLFYLDRQALLPRTQVLDGLDGAGDEDRTGFTPEGAMLRPAERVPTQYRRIHSRLRLAGARWVLAFAALPEDLLDPVGAASLPEIAEPLRLYALRDPLPRAFWVGRLEVVRDRAMAAARVGAGDFDPRLTALVEAPLEVAPGGSGPSRVSYEAHGPHEVTIHVVSPPGLVVVLDGYHEGWHAERDGQEVAVVRAYGRYRALVTPGGEHQFRLRYEPRGQRASTAVAAFGALAALALALRPKMGAHT